MATDTTKPTAATGAAAATAMTGPASPANVTGVAGWAVALGVAVAVPWLLATPFYLRTATVALVYVVLAVAYDLVIGRIGALSLCQPVFYAWGSYTAGLLALRGGNPGFWAEAALAVAGGVVLAVAIGIPAFRLSLHSFAIGTLGFALTAHLVALNWLDVTGGPLCVTPVPALQIPYGGGRLTVASGPQLYYTILAVAVLTVATVGLLARSRVGKAFAAVRDDPVLAAARGIWPLRYRLAAFTISAGFTALAGVFAAHFEHVVCPSQADFPITVLLLVMVLVGGRASLRGVVSAAVVFTAVPQLLRIADSWRLVFFGGLLLLCVTTVPGGLEHGYRWAGRQLRRLRPAASPAGGGGDG